MDAEYMKWKKMMDGDEPKRKPVWCAYCGKEGAIGEPLPCIPGQGFEPNWECPFVPASYWESPFVNAVQKTEDAFELPPVNKRPFNEGLKYETGLVDGNPKTRIGSTKPPVSAIPPVAILQLGQAMKDGRTKYGPMNWRDDPVTASVYYDAAQRHVMSWWDGEDYAADSGVHHLAHAMACFAIVLDAMQQGTLTDDRATPGKFSELVSALTRKAT